MTQRDASPVYYREIQKNTYLKRIPEEPSVSKLRPLALKKPPLKPLWTQLCVHNGRTPYLEQYRDAISARAHRPTWRHCLSTARHVTASVTSRENEYDFLIDTDDGPVRMLAPDWVCMQEWVTTLRNKLHELKILPPCENVYCSPPVAPPPRAAARDPTSPLPPTPPVPPDRVPGIDLTPITRPTIPEPETQNTQATQNTTIDNETTDTDVNVTNDTDSDSVDISNWDTPFTSLPSTSQLQSKKVAKICGQNVCLDDSIFKRQSDDSDDEFDDNVDYKQTVVVSDGKNDGPSDRPTNVTVIKVSNKEPPHSAIPVISPESVFKFDVKPENYVNIVNTETETNSDYGTVFETPEYGHLSLTTTVSLTGDVKVTDDAKTVNVKEEGVYERLCLASTDVESPLSVRRILFSEKFRKSSLPNLDAMNTNTSPTYEYLFLSQNNNSTTHNSSAAPNTTNTPSSTNTPTSSNSAPNSNNSPTSCNSAPKTANITSTSNITTVSTNSQTPIPTNNISNRTNIVPKTTNISTNIVPRTTNVINQINNTTNLTNTTSNPAISAPNRTNNVPNRTNITPNITNHAPNTTNSAPNGPNVTNISSENGNPNRVHVNAVAVSNVNSNLVLRAVERTNSQNAYDVSPRRERKTEKANGRVEKETPKPIWKRGLTELSLLTRLRGIGYGKRQESPPRNISDNDRNGVNPPNKVVHRSRPETRLEARRRSSSLSNGQSPSSVGSNLQPLRTRQAALLTSEQRRGAALVATVRLNDPPIFADYNKQVWVSWWGGCRVNVRVGDRVVGVGGVAPKDSAHAKTLLHNTGRGYVDILFHRVPLAKIYVVNKRDQETLGIKLDNECNILSIEPDSPASKAGIALVGKWAVTEVNNRPINLVKGGEDDMNRLSFHGTEASILIQPSALIKKLRSSLKGNKSILGLR